MFRKEEAAQKGEGTENKGVKGEEVEARSTRGLRDPHGSQIERKKKSQKKKKKSPRLERGRK